MYLAHNQLKVIGFAVLLAMANKKEARAILVEKFPELDWLNDEAQLNASNRKIRILSAFRSKGDEIAEFLHENNRTSPVVSKIITAYWEEVTKQKVIDLPKREDDPKIEASVAEMGASLVGAMLGVAKDMVQGRPVTVEPEELDRRMAICAGTDIEPKCEFFARESGRCSKCGCFAKFKNRLNTSSCPIGRW
jgi:hypothetical protein